MITASPGTTGAGSVGAGVADFSSPSPSGVSAGEGSAGLVAGAGSASGLIKSGRLKRVKDIMRAPKPIIKKKLVPDKARRGKMKFQRMRVRLTSPGHLMKAYLHYDPNKTAAPVMQQSTSVCIDLYTCCIVRPRHVLHR